MEDFQPALATNSLCLSHQPYNLKYADNIISLTTNDARLSFRTHAMLLELLNGGCDGSTKGAYSIPVTDIGLGPNRTLKREGEGISEAHC